MNKFTAPEQFRICTADQCREMDTRTIGEFGIDGFTLMEVAGLSASRELERRFGPGDHGVYLCGKGNNAGDALVVARYLAQLGQDASLVFLNGTDELSPDCSRNLELLEKIAGNDPEAGTIERFASWDEFASGTPETATFIVDGMLGTGLDSDLRGDYPKAVEWANRSDRPVFAIDIPTGLHSDTGKVMGSCIKATATFTFGARKLGFYLNSGFDHAGEVIYCKLPFPNYLKPEGHFLIDESWITPDEHSPARHKYEGGVLYIVAGSEGLTGAAVLAARSAWAEGLGAVILVTPRGNLSIFEKNLPQIIKKPVGDQDDHHFREEHTNTVLDILAEKEAKVLFGPGLGRDPSTVSFAHQLLETYDNDMIIDADGLWALSRMDDWKPPESARWILTPHPGELSTLHNYSVSDDAARMDRVTETCTQKQVTMVSKGMPVIVGTPGGTCLVTDYDTRTFSRAGFGDVLAGKIGAYWALGHNEAFSGALALLNGKKKAQRIRQQSPDHTPEPLDLV